MKTLPRFLAPLLVVSAAFAADPATPPLPLAGGLAYLDDPTPYLPTPQSPKLTTPQWFVEAVVVPIVDMPEAAKYEALLRPILERLKRIDGRAPVSIMTNTVPVDDPHFAGWLKEGFRSRATR